MEAVAKLGHDVKFTANGNYPLGGIDLVHVFNLNMFWTKVMMEECIKTRTPFVISAIFFNQVFHNSIGEMRKYCNWAKRVICLSETEKREMVEMLEINPDHIVVIPNGVDKTIFYDREKPKSGVISVGRLYEPMKGSQYLIRACAELGYSLTYIGESKDNDYCNRAKKLCRHIEYLPPDELAEELSNHKVYVCPSLSERQSLGVLEGAACGCTIVDSTHNRGAGLLPSSKIVNPEDIDALKSAILKQYKLTQTDHVPSWDDVVLEIQRIYES